MRFMIKSESYGIVAQFLHKTIHYVFYLLLLFALIYFAGSRIITVQFTMNITKAHIYRDFLIFFDLLICFCIYILFLIRFLLKQQKYISYLVDMIHFMKGGNFRQQIEIIGNNELSHLAAHIDELRKTVGQDKDNEKKKLEKEQQLLTSISHDLRTPLTTLTGYLEIILDDDFRDEHKRRQYLEHCMERANQLHYLISTTFEHFYLSGKEHCSIELLRCNSYQTLYGIVEKCSQIPKQQGYDVRYGLPFCHYSLVYDTRMMERLFDNIFTNVVRYAKPEQPVYISGESTKNTLKISVRNGIGSANIFNQSTGVGLKNCRQIMKIHGGQFFSEILEQDFLVTILLPIQNKG